MLLPFWSASAERISARALAVTVPVVSPISTTSERQPELEHLGVRRLLDRPQQVVADRHEHETRPAG